jgi:hypothetical protein
MKKILATLVALIALAVAAAPADAALSRGKALQHATKAAKQRARQDKRITEWEITRGFRFTDRKWVWAWWSQLADGRVCSAQLVTRYSSMKSTKIVAYFRNESCG